MAKRTIDVYCPNCMEQHWRKKLLFKCTPDSKGTIVTKCRGCRQEVKIELEEESRRAVD